MLGIAFKSIRINHKRFANSVSIRRYIFLRTLAPNITSFNRRIPLGRQSSTSGKQHSDEFVQKTLATLAIIRDHARKIDIVKNDLAEPLPAYYEGQCTSLPQPFSGLDSKTFSEMETWKGPLGQLFTNVPESLENKLRDVVISSIQFSFDIDKSDVENQLQGTYIPSAYELLYQPTIPVNFKTVIKGTIHLKTSKNLPDLVAGQNLSDFSEELNIMVTNLCKKSIERAFIDNGAPQITFDAKSIYLSSRVSPITTTPLQLTSNNSSDKPKSTKSMTFKILSSETILAPKDKGVVVADSANSRQFERHNSTSNASTNDSTGGKHLKIDFVSMHEIIGKRSSLGLMNADVYKKAVEEATKRRKYLCMIQKQKCNEAEKARKPREESVISEKKKKKDPCKIEPCDNPCIKKEKPKPCKPKPSCPKVSPKPCKGQTEDMVEAKDPCKKKEDPCKKKEDPCKKEEDPSKKKEDPCKKQEDPSKKKEDPCKKKEDPSKKKEDPCKKKEDPCKQKEDPCKKKEDPCKEKEDPCKKKEDPSKKKEDPSKKKEDPCKKKEDPCKMKADSNKMKEDPCQKKEDPCQKKEDPCEKKEDPCKMKPDSNKMKEDSRQKKEDPCQKKEDPCEKKEDPCKMKADSNKMKEEACRKNDPGQKKEDSCEKKEDPCKMKADSKKVEGNTCQKEEDPCKMKADSNKMKEENDRKKDAGQKKEDPCERKEDPCKMKADSKKVEGNTCQKKEDPSKMNADSNKMKENSCQKKEDNSKIKEAPCKMKADSNKMKEEACRKNDPGQKKEDSCEKKEDPCKMKADSKKVEGNTCQKEEDPCKMKADSNKMKEENDRKKDAGQKKEDPCERKEDPCKMKADSKKVEGNTCQKKEDPSKMNADSNKMKENSCQKKEDNSKIKEAPCKMKEDPCQKKEDPCKKVEDPCKNKEGPCKKKEDPCKKKKDPCKKEEDPCKKEEDPCKKKEDPCKKKEDPSKKKEDPCKKNEDPCKKKEDPCKKKEDPSKKKEDPCKKKEDPSKKKEDPGKKKQDPCKMKADSNKMEEDPCKKKEDPSKMKTDSEKMNEDPCKEKEDPCKKKEDPCKKKEDPCKKKEDPCKKKDDPSKKKEDPCKKKEDPCKKKEDPCKKKEDPCKKKEDPCKKKEDPSKKKEDPSKKKEDPSKKKEDPSKKKEDPGKKKDPRKKKEDPCKKKCSIYIGEESESRKAKNPDCAKNVVKVKGALPATAVKSTRGKGKAQARKEAKKGKCGKSTSQTGPKCKKACGETASEEKCKKESEPSVSSSEKKASTEKSISSKGNTESSCGKKKRNTKPKCSKGTDSKRSFSTSILPSVFVTAEKTILDTVLTQQGILPGFCQVRSKSKKDGKCKDSGHNRKNRIDIKYPEHKNCFDKDDCPKKFCKAKLKSSCRDQSKRTQQCPMKKLKKSGCLSGNPEQPGCLGSAGKKGGSVENVNRNKKWLQHSFSLLPNSLTIHHHKFLREFNRPYSTRGNNRTISHMPENVCNDDNDDNADKKKYEENFNKNEIIQVTDPCTIMRESRNMPCLTDYDALIRVDAVALSGSDIHLYETGAKACPGMTLGHDASGTVVHVGQYVRTLKPGDRVAIESGLSCGICENCKTGAYNMCAQMIFNGFLSKYQVHPADLCYKLPESINSVEASLTNILASGCQACFKGKITPLTNLLIIGSTATALSAAFCAQALGASNICLTCSVKENLDMTKRLFDIDYVHYNRRAGLNDILENIYSKLQNWPNLIINFAVSEWTMNMSVMALQPSSTCILAECESECASFNAMDVLMKNLQIIPSFRYTNMFPTALYLIDKGYAPMSRLISNCFSMDLIEDAFQAAQYEANVGNRKIIVKC